MSASFNPTTSTYNPPIDAEEFRQLVAELAYHKAEKRGFIAGHELEDWLAAECEVKNNCFYWFQEED
ncbi:MAG: DUF2934 domain-containing protein [Methylococcaceae bacterium]|jgi:hypothetical protein|nr:DUF2934 domain-containing protein [Methylococcaceae bacterium]MDZ4155220.1 DUF2934 domain-containing protein [Methylococcales bacterium]MDP2393508.1 DUF2934 domain-containing protein [Methylococcaceae bacterium]MDP3021378.1 DUF2934 domain-containing protein [Methylococcaceae bacterium]MDP3391031.1 DUF2934 domain-containing protein [Methylococcaceae bacterium]